MQPSRRRPPFTTRARSILARVVPTFLVPAVLAAPASGQRSSPADGPAPESAVERALESRAKGSPEAAVVVFEIADFQCPYCATFSATVAPALDARYVETGEVQWIFVNLPLHSHPLAWHAAEAALCAGAVADRFWPMHDRLFEEQAAWGAAADPAAHFAAYAEELGVPAAAFAECTAQDAVAPLILQDLGSVISAGITGTPTFIIMKDGEVVERMVGVQSVEEWAAVLDPALGR